MAEEKKVEKPKTQEEKMREFNDAYEKLCKEHGFQLVSVPTFAATNHGSYEVAVRVSVAPLR